jgi:maltose O-acetyltransferase
MNRIYILTISIISTLIKPLVFIECFFQNILFPHKGNGLFLKIWLRVLGVSFGKMIYLNKPFYLYGIGKVKIGEFCSFGEFTKLWNFGNIEIGDDFIAAAGLTITTGDHDPDTLKPSGKPVKIGNRVWCGLNVTILPGVIIGNDVVIGAGTLVIGTIPDESIVVGIPGRIIKKVDMTKRKEFFYCRRLLLAKSRI